MLKIKPLKRSKHSLQRSKPKRRKRSKESKLKEELEALQKAEVIKLYGRDCFTCSAKNLRKKNCQLGHVPWPRSILSTECKFNYRFTRIQCMVCNVHRGGMGAVALKRMQDEGVDTEDMWKFNEETKGKVYTAKWFEEQITFYQKK